MERRWLITNVLAWTSTSRSISVIHKVPGNGVPTRTPTVFCDSTSQTDPGYASRHLPIHQQSSRAFASTNASEGARHAPLQIDTSDPTVSEYTRRSVQPVQFGSTLDIGRSLSAIQTTRLCVLEIRSCVISDVGPNFIRLSI